MAATKKNVPAVDGETYLANAISRYSPEVAAIARAGLKKMRKWYPGARIMVYDRRQSLPFGFAPAEGSAIFSMVLYPRWVRFFFLEGVGLKDPEKRLEGSGSQVRSIKLDERAAVLDDPYIRGLMAETLKVSGKNLKKGSGEVVLKSTYEPQPSGSLFRIDVQPRGDPV